MGNNSVTGHAVNLIASSTPSQFHQTLELTMRQHGIQPWDPQSLLAGRIQRQKELVKNTPFRFVRATEGLMHFAPYSAAWVQSLSRERFVQLSQELFKTRNMMVNATDARVFYDVFDALDMYTNATLAPGELIGLSSFFSGTEQDHADGVFSVLDPQNKGEVTKDAVKQFVTPYVWAMVPENAAVVRPMMTDYVTDDIFHEIDMQRKNTIGRNDLYKWFQYGRPRQEVQAAAIAGGIELDLPILADVIAGRVAASMRVALQVAWQKYQDSVQLRQYGVQSYQATHNGQLPPVTDVGVYNYTGNYLQTRTATGPLTTQPQVSSMAAPVWSGMQQAGAAIDYHANTAMTAVKDMYTSYTRERGDSVVSVGTIGTMTMGKTLSTTSPRRYSVDGGSISMLGAPPPPPAPPPPAAAVVSRGPLYPTTQQLQPPVLSAPAPQLQAFPQAQRSPVMPTRATPQVMQAPTYGARIGQPTMFQQAAAPPTRLGGGYMQPAVQTRFR